MANPPLRLIPADKLAELPPTEHLGSTRLVARGLNVVFGASGSYKSFYVLGKALQIAQSLPVVYVAAEGSGGLNARVSAWCDYYCLPPGNLHFLCNEVNLRDPAAVSVLAKVAGNLKPKLIVIDTLARCMLGGDENSAKDVGMAIHGCFTLQQVFSASVCLVHHNNRADRGERGSGALRGAADTMIEVTTSGDGLVRLSCSKSKDEQPWDTEVLTFKQVGSSGVLAPAVDSLTVSLNLSPVEKQILEFLGLSLFDSIGAQVQQVVNALNISERHVYRLLSGLKNRGLAEHVKKGMPMKLTDIGLEILRTFADKTLPITPTEATVEVDEPS
jgi:predicted transcriptional regulator